MSKKKITLKSNNGDELYPLTVVQQVEGLKEALEGKLSLSGGTLTGSITAPTYVGATDKSGVYSEAIMSYTSAFANNDLNSERFLKAGMYRLDGVNNTINQPGGRGYGHLMTIRGGNSDTIAQMFFDYFDNGNTYIRTGSTNPNAGDFYILNRAWKQLLEDQVTTSHIAEKSINGSKIVSNVDLTGTPMMGVEPTFSSPDRTIASVGLVKEAVDGIEVGGRNLALDSNVVVENNTYVMYKCNTSEDLETDREYTMTIWGTLGSDRDSFRLYDSGVSVALGTFTLVSLNRYVLTFKYRGNYPRLLNILQFHSTSTSSSVIQKVKLERGNKATDWSPAPEDVNKQLSDTLNDKLEGYASIQYVDNKVASIGTPGNATETGAGIVRAATQVEVAAGHVSDNDPAEMAFVRPETLQSKLSNYPTTTAMTQAINESRQIIYYQSSQPSGGKNGDIWIKP